MPLPEGKENIGRNIKTEMEHDKPRKQAIAIALRVAGVPKAKDAAEAKPVNYAAQMHQSWRKAVGG